MKVALSHVRLGVFFVEGIVGKNAPISRTHTFLLYVHWVDNDARDVILFFVTMLS